MEGSSKFHPPNGAPAAPPPHQAGAKNRSRKMCYNEVARAKGSQLPTADIPRRDQRIQGQDNDELAREPSVVFKSDKKRYYLKEPRPIILSGRRVGYGKPIWTSTGTADYDEALAFMKANARTPEQLAEAPNGKGLTFRKLTQNFFAVSSPWTRWWKGQNGYIPRDLKDKASDLRLHLGPYLNHLRPDQITPSIISSLIYDKLKGEEGLSSSSCSQILSTLRSILDFWIETSDGQILDSNPARARKMRLEKDAAVRDILTDEEFKKHYDPRRMASDWVSPRHGGSKHADARCMYTGSALGNTTGMRLAEIQGLQFQHVHLDDPEGPWIQVEWQWDRDMKKLVPPKNKRERNRVNSQGKRIKATKEEERTIVGLTPTVAKNLRIIIAQRNVTKPEHLVFHKDGNMYEPWNYRVWERWDHYALEKIGVDWKGRNIVFHSSRHFAATLADETAGEEVGRSMTGHNSKVYFNYVHQRIQRQKPVIDKLERMLNDGVLPELGLVQTPAPSDQEIAASVKEVERGLAEALK